jgi:rfaE bifunctional protein kinase chain/domain
MKALKVSKSRFSKARVLVVGDVMLDRYWFGHVDRISPEAPVPVVRVDRSEERPGGAANVARNVAALGAKATLLSVVGRDEAAKQLESLLKKGGVRLRLLRDRSVATTVKLRVIGRAQQLLRVDFEAPPTGEVLATLMNEYQALLEQHDVVILSDYGKGGLTHIQNMITAARALKKIILVDPKGEDYSRYRGASILTPNMSEFRQVAGKPKDEKDLTARAQKLRKALRLEALLVTRSEEGMTLYRGSEHWHVPAQAREVYDVSGAGDTVIATLGVALATGMDWEAGVALANQAAGIVVAKFGTAVVSAEELLDTVSITKI